MGWSVQAVCSCCVGLVRNLHHLGRISLWQKILFHLRQPSQAIEAIQDRRLATTQCVGKVRRGVRADLVEVYRAILCLSLGTSSANALWRAMARSRWIVRRLTPNASAIRFWVILGLGLAVGLPWR